jgi:hypothetical protein
MRPLRGNRYVKATLKKVFGRASRESKDPREKIHFLHIGKTAGTQFELLADHLNATQTGFRIIKENHLFDLRNLSIGQPYLFSIRSPHGRFKSGFYSRKRQGLPRYDNPWSPYEVPAFEWFEHANDLAEALFEDGKQGYRAMSALQAIGHCAKQQVQWFNKCGTFMEVNPPLAILRQEHFGDDVALLLGQLNVDAADMTMSEDDDKAHKTDYSDIPPLSEKALINLRMWYAPDYEFCKWCDRWVEETKASGSFSFANAT